MNTIQAKTGQRVKVTDPKFHYFSHGSICECINIGQGTQQFRLLKGTSQDDGEYWMDENDYEIIEEQTEQPETITPSMVVISWADWLEYQNLKNK